MKLLSSLAGLVMSISLLLVAITSCKKEGNDPNYVPGDLAVGFKDTTQIHTAFALINRHRLVVDIVSGFTYEMPYTADSISTLIEFFNQRPYINPGTTKSQQSKASTGTVYYSPNTRSVLFTCRLFEMDSADQRDFLQVISDKRMRDRNNNIKYIRLKVPHGKEKYLLNELKKDESVKWAELNEIMRLE